MTYSVKELFLTIQGEGFHTGRLAVFCRFAGCNLWNGLEKDRSSAICQFCDTDFVGTDGEGGGKFESAQELCERILDAWGNSDPNHRFVVLTGGEPGLQIDQALVDALHQYKFTIAIETNGTVRLPQGIDWICVSPKLGSELVTLVGDELKLVVPQSNPTELMKCIARYEKMSFQYHYLQPLDNEDLDKNRAYTLELIRKRPLWKLSTQTHKILGIK